MCLCARMHDAGDGIRSLAHARQVFLSRIFPGPQQEFSLEIDGDTGKGMRGGEQARKDKLPSINNLFLVWKNYCQAL